MAKGISFVAVSLILVTMFFYGCNTKDQGVTMKHSNNKVIPVASTEEKSLDIKNFLLNAEAQVQKLNEGNTSLKVIGQFVGVDVLEYLGEYNSIQKVNDLLGNYFTEEMIELELNKRYFANINGRIGCIAASGENTYFIEEKSKIKLILDQNNKKIVQVDGFNDFGDSHKIEYIIEKFDDGKWRISGEKGFSEAEVIIKPTTSYNYSAFTGDWICKDKKTSLYLNVDQSGNVKGSITTVVGFQVPSSSIFGTIRNNVLTSKLYDGDNLNDNSFVGTLMLSFADAQILKGTVKLDKSSKLGLAEGDMSFKKY